MPGQNQGPESLFEHIQTQWNYPLCQHQIKSLISFFKHTQTQCNCPLHQYQIKYLRSPPLSTPTDITESTPTLVPNQAPDALSVSQVDADPEELPPAPEPDSGIEDGSTDALSSAHWSNKIAERTSTYSSQTSPLLKQKLLCHLPFVKGKTGGSHFF